MTDYLWCELCQQFCEIDDHFHDDHETEEPPLSADRWRAPTADELNLILEDNPAIGQFALHLGRQQVAQAMYNLLRLRQEAADRIMRKHNINLHLATRVRQMINKLD